MQTRTSNRSRRSTSSTGADVHEEVEILMQSPTSRQQGERVTIEHQFIDFKVDIPHSKGFHAQWLQSINLLEYARLPWSRWRHTTEVGMHVSNLVESNGLVGYGVYLSAELVSKVFALQQGEENHVDKASKQIMDREFGKCEGTRGYYLIKNVANLDRALQIKWFLERFLLLVKLEYVSRENYAIISAAEQGRNFGWTNMLYDRLHSEFFCKDKRKTQRSTKIGPLITAIFSYVIHMKFAWIKKSELTDLPPSGSKSVKKEVAYLKLEMRNKIVSDQEVDAIKTKLRSTESQLECALKKINFYSEQMHRRESSARIYKEWMMEWDNIFHQQLEVLSTVNVALEAKNKVLLDRVSACKEVEKKIKECAEDELEIEGCFMSGTDVDTMKMELQKHLEPIWTEMKEKLLEIRIYGTGRPQSDKLCSSNSQEQMLGKKYYSLHGHQDPKNGVTKSNLLAVNPVNDHSRTTALKVFPLLQPSVLCPQEPGFAVIARQQVFKEGGSFCKAHIVPFPLDPSRDVEVSSDSCTRSSTCGCQLTIFYQGQVNVYNNVSSAMAQHIVLFGAGGDHPSVQYPELSAKDYASQLACSPYANADQNEKILNIINVSERPYTTQANGPSACSRTVQDNLEDSSIARLSDKEAEPVVPQSLLQARKASLARFLERRKARLMTTFPYNCLGTNHKSFT
ncbi:hypothetical protein L7F22_010850 [Adiantum nelumboides]|nr:hypothetical protein [Adiantum nelumboides]